MTSLTIQFERKDDGVVQVRVLDADLTDEPNTLIWECTVAQEHTRRAQKAALKATLDYLHTFIDLSQGGRY